MALDWFCNPARGTSLGVRISPSAQIRVLTISHDNCDNINNSHFILPRIIYAENPQELHIEKTIMKIKDIVKNNTAYFLYYRHQHIYYGVDTSDGKYMFPIPLEDVQDATINASEKAITVMRYIRKALDDSTFVLQQ